MGSRSEDEKTVPEKHQDHASPGQGQDQDQDQVLSAEEAMGNRGEDDKMLPEKDEDAPSDCPQDQAQDQENVRQSLRPGVRQRQPVLQGHDKERSKKRKLRGVWKRRNGRWAAEIRDRYGTRRWLGTYATEQEAGLAFDRGAKKYGRPNVTLNFPQLNFPKPSKDMLERVFKIKAKKARTRRHPVERNLPSSERCPPIPRRAPPPDLPSSSARHPTNHCSLISKNGKPNLSSSGRSRPPVPHPAQPDLPPSRERHVAKPRPAIGHAREGDRERNTSRLTLLQAKLNQFMVPFFMMLEMFVDDLTQKRPCAILIELVKVFLRCISRINYFAHFNKKSQRQHEFATALCSITNCRLAKLSHKRDQKRAGSKHPANPDLPSTSTAVVSEERLSDAESSIEMREAFRERKNLSSSWLKRKLNEVLAPLRMMLRTFVDDLMQESVDAILKRLVKTFIYCISRARSLAQRFDMAQRESGLEVINYGREGQHEFAVELGLITLQQLGELYPSLQLMSQGNSVNLDMHHSFIREHTNDVNMRDRPSTSVGVIANVEAVSSHQNAANAGKQDSGDQGNATAEVGPQGILVGNVTQELVALLEEEHDLEICAIEALLSLSSTSQEVEGKE